VVDFFGSAGGDIDTSSFTHLYDIVMTGGIDQVNVSGTRDVDITMSGFHSDLSLSYGYSGNATVIGNGNELYVAAQFASGQDKITLIGNNEEIIGGTGDHQVLEVDGSSSDLIAGFGNDQTLISNGGGNVLVGDAGTGDILKSSSAHTTMWDEAYAGQFVFGAQAGADMKLIGTGGHSTFYVGDGQNETVILKQSGNNTVYVFSENQYLSTTSQGVKVPNDTTTTIEGTVASDIINFADSAANVTATAIKGGEHFVFSDTGQVVNVLGHAAINFGVVVDPA
jgi:hypothetical protein